MQPDIESAGNCFLESKVDVLNQCHSSQIQHLVHELFAQDNLSLSILCNCRVSTNYSFVRVDFPGCHLRPCCFWQQCFTFNFNLFLPFCLQKLSGWKRTHQDKQRDSFSDRSVLWAGSPHGETFVLPEGRMWGSMVRAWQLLQQPELGLRQWNYNFWKLTGNEEAQKETNESSWTSWFTGCTLSTQHYTYCTTSHGSLKDKPLLVCAALLPQKWGMEWVQRNILIYRTIRKKPGSCPF